MTGLLLKKCSKCFFLV